MDGGLTSSNYHAFCKMQKEMKRHKHIKTSKMSKNKLSRRELLEEIYKNVRWNGDVLEQWLKSQPQTKDGEPPLVGDRPPKRP